MLHLELHLLSVCCAGWGRPTSRTKQSTFNNQCMLQVVDYYKGRVVDLVADKPPEDVASQIRQAL